MVRDGQIGLEDAKRVLRRYWVDLPITVMGCGDHRAAARNWFCQKSISRKPDTCSTARCPDRYREAVVTEDLNHRLASMQEQI